MNLAVQMASYFAVVTLGAMSPGPDFAVVTRHSILGGRLSGIAASAGVATGMAMNTTAAVAGLGALLSASPDLYTAIKLIGAAYLVYLGVRALLSLRGGSGGLQEISRQAPDRSSLLRAYREGLFANFLNPKVVVFLVTLMPQFLPPHPTLWEQLLIGVVSVVAVMNWFSVLALAVSAARRLFQKPKVRKAINGITGAALVAVGLKVAIS
jgi:threonine/homoserine/homoserine lactone efflux protein